MRNKHSHEMSKPTLISHFRATRPVNHSMGVKIVALFQILISELSISYIFFSNTPYPGHNNRHKQWLAALLTRLALTYWEVYQSKKAQPRCLQEALLSCLLCRAGCHRICSSPGSHTCF